MARIIPFFYSLSVFIRANFNPMSLLARTQELARRFNEAEAIQQDFERRWRIRLLLGAQLPLSEKMLDDLDWLAALRSCRQTRAIAQVMP